MLEITEEMVKVHQILNYSFAELDIDHYIERFISERQKGLDKLLPDTKYAQSQLELDKPEKIAGTIMREYCHEPVSAPNITSNFMTGEVLTWMLRELAEGHEISKEYINILNQLQQRFEVGHRLFDQYDANVRAQGDSFQTVLNYALLSILLNLCYTKDGNPNTLNTAVKINDLLLKSGWPFDAAYAELITFAILLEGEIILSLYEE